MISVTVASKHKTHIFHGLPVNWDSVVGPVERVSVHFDDVLALDVHAGDDCRIFGFNAGINNLSTGQTDTSFVCGAISDEYFGAWETKETYEVTDRPDLEEQVRRLANQKANTIVK